MGFSNLASRSVTSCQGNGRAFGCLRKGFFLFGSSFHRLPLEINVRLPFVLILALLGISLPFL